MSSSACFQGVKPSTNHCALAKPHDALASNLGYKPQTIAPAHSTPPMIRGWCMLALYAFLQIGNPPRLSAMPKNSRSGHPSSGKLLGCCKEGARKVKGLLFNQRPTRSTGHRGPVSARKVQSSQCRTSAIHAISPAVPLPMSKDRQTFVSVVSVRILA